MDIRFCAISNESIPDSDFENGKAVTVDGRSYYVHHAMGKLLKGRGPIGWLTLLLALFAAGVATFLLVVHLGKKEADPNLVSDGVSTHVARADQALESRLVESQRTAVDTLASRVSTQLSALQADLRDARKAHNQQADIVGKRAIEVSGRLDRMQGAIVTLQKDIGTINEWMTKIEQIAEEVQRLREEQQKLAERAVVGPDTPGPDGGGETPNPNAQNPNGQNPDTPGTQPGTGTSKPRAADHDAQLEQYITQLASKDQNLVFVATVKLSELGDLRAVPPLLKVLKRHGDFYARLGAATALGVLKSVDAVPDLIDALNEKDDLVRVAANDALVLITGEKIVFSSSLSRNERTRKQREWRAWFKENETALRTQLNQPAG